MTRSICPDCDGLGGDADSAHDPETGHPVWTRCENCDGTGEVEA